MVTQINNCQSRKKREVPERNRISRMQKQGKKLLEKRVGRKEEAWLSRKTSCFCCVRKRVLGSSRTCRPQGSCWGQKLRGTFTTPFLTSYPLLLTVNKHRHALALYSDSWYTKPALPSQASTSLYTLTLVAIILMSGSWLFPSCLNLLQLWKSHHSTSFLDHSISITPPHSLPPKESSRFLFIWVEN